MLLGFTFILSLASSLGWFVFCYYYLLEKLNGVTLFSLGAIDLLVCMVIVVLPILTIWAIFGFINSYISHRSTDKNFKYMFEQIRRNQDYSDLLARAMIEGENRIKSGFALNKLDMYFSELNEAIADILANGGIPQEQIINAWANISKGEKSALGKLLINKKNHDAIFNNFLLSKNNFDKKGSLITYCEIYQSLRSLMEKYDRDNTVRDLIEEGIFGKVFAVISPFANVGVSTPVDAPKPINKEIPQEKKAWFSKDKGENPVEKDPFYMFLKNENEDKKKPFSQPVQNIKNETD